ncbi:hypothetical protein QBC44DRAFT_353586 [Cladorrhinum sp. PSN332]|nr:hypothetical protein QBC44DRAFT_353586 [Cladorrhinum sp. PSN332]
MDLCKLFGLRASPFAISMAIMSLAWWAVADQGPTAVSDCSLRNTNVYCVAEATEYIVYATATSDIPTTYTGCHAHGSNTFCLTSSGEDVGIELATEENEPLEENCHFHAGVEHCVGGAREQDLPTCDRIDRDYNVPLRIGLLFAILVTSTLGVFSPILLAKHLPSASRTPLLILKQFGTGVIISTSLVHLFTHAELMFNNECLGPLAYEAVTAAIAMAGLFLSFLVEYLGHRLVKARVGATDANDDKVMSTEMLSIYVMEAGIIFHSLIIGLTLVVAGDRFLLTLFAVILFHQMFEGLALGTRIASLGTYDHLPTTAERAASQGSDDDGWSESKVSMSQKITLAAAFALVTPLGMAIGIGVLSQFNGNDPQTIVAIGVLDALSAGILLWVGVVEMWASDWAVESSVFADADAVTTGMGLGGLVTGMVAMSVLGKWA